MKKARILSFGTNMMGDSDGTEAGIHAEHNALTKLKPLKFKRTRKNKRTRKAKKSRKVRKN